MAENRILEFNDNDKAHGLFGELDSNLAHLEKQLGISIVSRGNQIALSGSQDGVSTAETVLNTLWQKIGKKQTIGTAEIDAELRFLNKPSEKTKTAHNKAAEAKMDDRQDMAVKTRKKSIMPRSPNQALYMDAIRNHPMVFGLGPAGTGKTYLAVAMGMSLYLEGKVERLIFCRPAVEAGERLGFLPGDMQEKIDPYLRPIYDALHDMMPWDEMMKKMASGDIEVAPLAFMRGRTLSNAFVILDEAQNTTCTQMKMFLTRMGEASRMVITGDLTQTDLPPGVKSGLRDAVETLETIEDIYFMTFAKEDVIRHPLVSKIVHAYSQQQ